jgi:hypothetical protein
MMRLSGSVKLRVAGPIRQFVAAPVFAESLVLFGIRRLGGRQHASDLGFQFRLAFFHALITHRFMFRRVRFDLRAIERDMAELDRLRRLAQPQNLQDSAPSAFKCRLRKSLIVRKSGGSSATIIKKSFRSRIFANG